MAVPVHERQPSPMEYLNQTILLEEEILNFIKKTPKDYKDCIGKVLFEECVVALRHGKTANAIFVKTQRDLDNRKYELNQMRGAIDSIPCHMCAWSRSLRNSNAVSQAYKKTLAKKEERISEQCEKIIKLIDGLKKSDSSRFKKENSGCSAPKDLEDLIYVKSQLKRECMMLDYLKSISVSLKNLEIQRNLKPLPEDLEEYDWPEVIKRRFEIDEQFNNQGDNSGQNH